MPNVIKDKLRDWREFRVERLTTRIEHLSECIAGTDEELHPEMVADYYSDRQSAALRRSAILSKLDKE